MVPKLSLRCSVKSEHIAWIKFPRSIKSVQHAPAFPKMPSFVSQLLGNWIPAKVSHEKALGFFAKFEPGSVLANSDAKTFGTDQKSENIGRIKFTRQFPISDCQMMPGI